MDPTVKMVFGLLGGLAMFLFGMGSMSDSLQKVAGARMKAILGFLTKNPVMGALAGALVTAVLQSSSATTVMVIGFVSAGLMTLPQGISVIFGANIGTTMTAQLIAFKISNYIYPILFIGFLMNFLGKKERTRSIGMVIFSFGLLFEGIEVMGSVMKPMAASPVFTELMGRVSHTPVLGVLLGACMTLVVQSSSATIAVLQSFASQPGADGVSSVIGLTGAIPILFGDNIGTTITALLASIGQSKDAKRTALAHSIFNITGTCVFIWFIPLLAKFVTAISPKGNEVDVIARQIANAHTTFNIICTLVWLPLLPLMVKIVTAIVRGDDRSAAEKFQPKFLDNNVIGQPVAAMVLVSEELLRTADLTANMLKETRNVVLDGGEEVLSAYAEMHTAVKSLAGSISDYISRMLAGGGLTGKQSEQTASLLFVTNNLDRMADRCEDIDKAAAEIRTTGKTLSEAAYGELEHCFRLAGKMLDRSVNAVRTGDPGSIEQVVKGRNKMRKAQKKFNKAHLMRVENGLCDAALGADYSGILYNLDRIVDGCVGITEEALDNGRVVALGTDPNRGSSSAGRGNNTDRGNGADSENGADRGDSADTEDSADRGNSTDHGNAPDRGGSMDRRDTADYGDTADNAGENKEPAASDETANK